MSTMMKKLAVVLFLLVACSIQVQGRDIAKVQPAWPFWHGWNFPHPPLSAPKWPHPFPHPFPHPPLAAPKWPHPSFSDPKVKTCLTDLSAVCACVPDLFLSNPKPECCSTLQKVGDDCANSVFSAPFFKMLVKQHCSSN
ncbi:hypothetical protein QYF36_015414 [Acer negundo]|nr:hypothetical protein QYF36_015414 [Acer negundo]